MQISGDEKCGYRIEVGGSLSYGMTLQVYLESTGPIRLGSLARDLRHLIGGFHNARATMFRRDGTELFKDVPVSQLINDVEDAADIARMHRVEHRIRQRG